MRRRRGAWLVFAGGLFALAAWLMLSGQGEEEAPAPAHVEFPRKLRPQESARMENRRTYVAPVAQAPLDAGTQPARPMDPVLAALPRGKGKSAVIIEANALRHSPLGEMVLECLMRRGSQGLEDFKRQTGVDPLQDLDRLVLSEEGIVLSGNFGDPRLQRALQEQARTTQDYGPGARIYEPPPEVDTGRPRMVRRMAPHVGVWNNQLLVFGESSSGVKDVLDRLDGRGPDAPPVLDESQTYGEMYGVLSAALFQKLLPPEQQALAAKLAEVAENVELHVDASSDFAMTARVRGEDRDKLADLGKSLGGAMSLARMKAQSEGDTRLAQLLDFAKVRPEGDSFQLEMAVPLDAIKQQLSFCRDQPERDPSPTPAAQEPAPTPPSP